jgi:hypothetical protein
MDAILNVSILLAVLLLSLFAAYVYVKIRQKHKNISFADEKALTQEASGNQASNRLSLLLNWMLRIALVPLFLFALVSIIPTVMMSDSGANTFVYAMMLLSFGICWGLPISVIFIIWLSEKYRKNGKVLLSIIIQVITLFVASIPFILLFA